MDEYEEDELNTRMLPPLRPRRSEPRVCNFCREFRYGDGFWYCVRPNGANGDTGDGEQMVMTCDRFRRAWDKAKN